MDKMRIRAVRGLCGFALALAGFQTLPLGAPLLSERREWIRSWRAGWKGAQYVGESGTVFQAHANDCGAACLKMVLSQHGVECSLSDLAWQLKTTARGTSMYNLRTVSTRFGVPARSWVLQAADLRNAPLPAIAFIEKNHFVVIQRFANSGILEIGDPALGTLHWPLDSFRKCWQGEILIFDPDWLPP
jgi:ABC-type bacteriocin/lantibiotic exporter with double-glycine peptidase domain